MKESTCRCISLGLYGLVAVSVVCGLAGCNSDESLPVDDRPKELQNESSSEPLNNDLALAQTAIRMMVRTESSGVDFSYTNGELADRYTILETLGGGVGVLDFDADGKADIILTGGGVLQADDEIRGAQSVLYRNEGAWSFRDTTVAANLGGSAVYTHGVAVSDYDHDGFQDFVVTGYRQLQMFRNQGDGTFLSVSQETGVVGEEWSTSAAFADLSGDGNPDLYVCHYVDWSFKNDPACYSSDGKNRDPCSPRRFEPIRDSLFVSSGDGAFFERSNQMGLSDEGKGLGLVIADFDLDDDLDVYVANDTVPNFLYRNDDGVFSEHGLASGSALNAMGTPDGSMGVSLGDFNADGRPDLWVANFERENFALYRNDGRLQFLPVSQSMGIVSVGAGYVGWGTAFVDLDIDGDEDIVVANGHVNRHPVGNSVRQLPLLFENHAGKRFKNVSENVGGYFSSLHRWRGLATGDFDLDGDIDLVVTHLNEPVELLENISTRSGNWIQVRLVGTFSSRIPVGARITVTADDVIVQTRQLYAGGSYLSSSDDAVLLAAGTADFVDLRIHWPSGKIQLLKDVKCNQRLTVIER